MLEIRRSRGEFDAVVSLNGFHAFPDKEAAYREYLPSFETGRRFLRLFLCGRRKRAHGQMDKAVCVRAGFFTPPFETPESLRERLILRMYRGDGQGNLSK